MTSKAKQSADRGLMDLKETATEPIWFRGSSLARMKSRTALVCLSGVFVVILAGCSGSTDVSKATNDAYHAHEGGPPPPPGAMKGPAVNTVGPFSKTGGVAPNVPAAPISGAGVGPGGTPVAAGGK